MHDTGTSNRAGLRVRLGIRSGLAMIILGCGVSQGAASAGPTPPGPAAGTPTAQMMANTCAACHGTGGHIVNSAFVPLAGMPEEVFVQTMLDFRAESRQATLMGSVAKGFSEAEIRDMAGYFAKLPPVPGGEADAPAVANSPTGEMMADTCAACHGTGGRIGNSAFVPLAGMPEELFVQTMLDFRGNRRQSTLMESVALGFSEVQIRSMARFFANQPMVMSQ